jgi:hypothetical protein
MNLQILLTVTGILLSVISSFVLFYLNAIKNSQIAMISEIKEMNKDIRDMLVSIGKADENFASISERVNKLEIFCNQLKSR